MQKFSYKEKLGVKVTIMQDAIIKEILNYTNKKGYAFPAQETIAKKLGISRHTVLRHLKKIEKIKINGLSFLIRLKKRNPGGQYSHTLYYFPFVKNYKKYLQSHTKEIIKKIEEEFFEKSLEELIKLEDNHVAKNHSNKKRENSIFYIRDLVNRISEKLKLNSNEVLKILINIGFELNNNTTIWHLDKYIIKAFKNSGTQLKAEKQIKDLYISLIGEEDLFSVDLDGFVKSVLPV